MKHVDLDSFRRFARLAFMGLLVLSAFFAGCRPDHPARSVLECRLSVVEPVLGPLALDVLGRCSRVGSPEPLRLALGRLGLTPGEILSVVDAWHACTPPAPLPFPDAGVLETLPE